LLGSGLFDGFGDWFCNRLGDWFCNRLGDWFCNRLGDWFCDRLGDWFGSRFSDWFRFSNGFGDRLGSGFSDWFRFSNRRGCRFSDRLGGRLLGGLGNWLFSWHGSGFGDWLSDGFGNRLKSRFCDRLSNWLGDRLDNWLYRDWFYYGFYYRFNRRRRWCRRLFRLRRLFRRDTRFVVRLKLEFWRWRRRRHYFHRAAGSRRRCLLNLRVGRRIGGFFRRRQEIDLLFDNGGRLLGCGAAACHGFQQRIARVLPFFPGIGGVEHFLDIGEIEFRALALRKQAQTRGGNRRANRCQVYDFSHGSGSTPSVCC
jgi:hypothetical protein